MNPTHLESGLFLRRAGAALLLALALAACGGGGADSESVPEAGPPAEGEIAITGTIEGLGASTIALELITGPPGTPVGQKTETITVGNGPFAFNVRAWTGGWAVIFPHAAAVTPSHVCRPAPPGNQGSAYHWAQDPLADQAVVAFKCGPAYRLRGTATGETPPRDSVDLLLAVGGQPTVQYAVPVPGPFEYPPWGQGQANQGAVIAGESYHIEADRRGCRVTNGGTGVMPAHDVEDIVVHCGTQLVKTEVIGLIGEGLQLTLASQPAAPNSPPVQETLNVSTNGVLEFEVGLSEGDPYAVTITTAPSSPTQECTVENGSGTVGTEDVTVVVRCENGLQREWAFFRHDELANGDSAELGVVDVQFEMPEFPGLGRSLAKIGVPLGINGLDLYDNLFHLPGTNMAVFSNETGKTYWIATEAANGQTERTTELVTRWWIRKDADDAKFTLQITDIWLDAFVDGRGGDWEYEHDARLLRSSAQVFLDVVPVPLGSTQPGPSVFHLSDTVIVSTKPSPTGGPEDFELTVLPDSQASRSIFSEADFRKDTNWLFADRSAGYTKVSLNRPLDSPVTIDVDLSNVRLRQTVLVEMTAVVSSQNAYSNESHAVAYFRDPAQFNPGASNGGVTVTQMSGISLVRPQALPADYRPLPAETPAPACAAPDAPRAQLQFGAAAFRMPEGDLGNHVTITRTGSTAGDVTARVRMAAGTATAGVDYTTRVFFVRFPDGQSARRGIVLPLIDDTLVEGPETLQLALEDVSGCAELGPQANATVTLLDDEVSTPPPPPSLDSSFDGDGKVALPGVGFDGGTGLALQPDGKILIAGGGSRSFVQRTGFVLARFHADGRLDADFGAGGVVLTEIPNHSVRTPQRVVVQPDGKIVVAGFAAGAGSQLFPVLARYLADGTPDPGFGAGGVVVATTTGTVYALALMPDGRIVVAGAALRSGPTDFADVMVRRYLPNGTPDGSFGTAGLAVVDVAGKTNEANALVLLPGGGVIATGQAVGTADTAIVQLTPQGQPDPAFGIGGVRDLAGLAVGAGLARQADGKLLLVGHDGGVPSRLAMLRLMPDGATDPNFGNGGMVTTTTSSAPHLAHAVAVTSSGRILVAGEGGLNRNFVLARYLADGTPDQAFNGTGAIVADFDLQHDIAKTLVIQPDGRVVLGGTATIGIETGFALVRVLP